jgi:hypothetical protein
MADKWVGVDLDGTLAYYDGWKGPEHIGDPIPAMVERVRGWLARGITVKIFTARVGSHQTQEHNDVAHRTIATWCMKYLGCVLHVTNEKDFAMTALWDDRAFGVHMNTGMPADIRAEEAA